MLKFKDNKFTSLEINNFRNMLNETRLDLIRDLLEKGEPDLKLYKRGAWQIG